jgi:RNA ligase (TIGR02306 family)
METLTLPEAAERALVTLETVPALTLIENADAIEACRVRGWNVVVKKGEVAVGDRVCYFEIDSFLSLADDRFAFLEPLGSKTVDGVLGHVLKTARLRGVYCHGLALPAGLIDESLFGLMLPSFVSPQP